MSLEVVILARLVKCRITGEMISKDLAIKVGDKFYTESLYEDFKKLKDRKERCVAIYKKKIGASERMPVPAVNKIIDDFVNWYSIEAVEHILRESYQLKGTDLNGRVAYLKAVLNNKIVPAQQLVESQKKALDTKPIIEAEVLTPVVIQAPSQRQRRKKLFF